MPQEQMPEIVYCKPCNDCRGEHAFSHGEWGSYNDTGKLPYVPASSVSALAERVKEAEIDAEKCHRLMMEADSDRVEAERRANSLAERVERAEVLLKECGEYARKTSFCQEDDGWQLRAKESADFADRISSFLHDGTKGVKP